MTMRYRKRPVEIDAHLVWEICQAYRFQSQGYGPDAVNELPEWVTEAVNDGVLIVGVNTIEVTTLEGNHVITGDNSNMLIKGVQGELYGCEGSIFTQTYQEVTP